MQFELFWRFYLSVSISSSINSSSLLHCRYSQQQGDNEDGQNQRDCEGDTGDENELGENDDAHFGGLAVKNQSENKTEFYESGTHLGHQDEAGDDEGDKGGYEEEDKGGDEEEDEAGDEENDKVGDEEENETGDEEDGDNKDKGVDEDENSDEQDDEGGTSDYESESSADSSSELEEVVPADCRIEFMFIRRCFACIDVAELRTLIVLRGSCFLRLFILTASLCARLCMRSVIFHATFFYVDTCSITAASGQSESSGSIRGKLLCHAHIYM
jgi:hypothetical protein